MFYKIDNAIYTKVGKHYEQVIPSVNERGAIIFKPTNKKIKVAEVQDYEFISLDKIREVIEGGNDINENCF